MIQAAALPDRQEAVGPPRLNRLDHVSMPCRDLEEGIRFYRDVLGGEIVVTDPFFALFRIAGMRMGIGSVGCTFMTPHSEYPHIAFNADADALVRMKSWLAACGIPTSGYWSRRGVETLMFFRDPSGNVIELFCDDGFEGRRAAAWPVARPRNHPRHRRAGLYEWRLPDAGGPVTSQGRT